MGGQANGVAFPVTSWSLVDRAAAARDGDAARAALGTLLTRYLPALRARLVIDRRMDADRADDLLQGFVSDRVLCHQLLGRADRERGRFRTFILTALDHYVTDVRRYETAGVRSPGTVSANVAVAASDFPDADAADAPTEFERAWACQVVEQTVERMRGECARKGRHDLWGVFHARVLAPTTEGAEPMSYETLVERFGLRSLEHASNVLMTAKRMFARSLCDVVGEYAGEPADVRQEIAELRAALARAGGGGRPRI